MADYAKRLSLQITDEQPILIGLSFGGMMAMELAKIIKVQKIVLLASAKSANELQLHKSIRLSRCQEEYLWAISA